MTDLVTFGRLALAPVDMPIAGAVNFAVPAQAAPPRAGRRGVQRVVLVPAPWLETALTIIREVCAERNTCVKDVLGGSRFTEHQTARYAAIRRIKAAVPAITATMLAAIFAMHHSTILYVLGRRAGRRGTCEVRP